MAPKSFFRGFALVSLVSAAIAIGACTGRIVDNRPCPEGKTSCNGECVDLKSDDAHCGTCGGVCSTGACVAGECTGDSTTAAGGAGQGGAGQGGAIQECPPGETACPSGCFDLQNADQNCGVCGHNCGPYGECYAGTCGDPQSCVSCADYITPGSNPDNLPLCEGLSADLYDAVASCVCAGACMDQCSDNVCAGMDATVTCQTCVADKVSGCGNEFYACATDP